MNNCQFNHKNHDHIDVRTDVGQMTIYNWKKYQGLQGFCTGQDDVSKTLDLYGRWDQPIKQCIEQLIYKSYPNGTFIDVGSHVGYFSRLAASYNWKVFAYEAESESVALTQKNIPEAKVQQIWFDEHTQEHHFDNDFIVDIMKIDIEGSEQHAIRYFSPLFADRKVQNLIIEVSPVFNGSYPILLKMLQSLGYTVRELNGELFSWKFDFAQTNLWLHL